MRLGTRGRIFAFSLGLLVGVGALLSPLVAGQVRNWLEDRVRHELLDKAHLVAAGINVDPAQNWDQGRALLVMERMKDRSDVRLSIIHKSGVVLADSRVQRGALAELENHGGRAEVKAALAGQDGFAQRKSATLKSPMLYVATPLPPNAVLRLSIPLNQVDQVLATLRWGLLILAGLGLLVALAMTQLSAQLYARALSRLVRKTKAAAAGKGDGKIQWESKDEMGRLARSFNKLMGSLDDTMADLDQERSRLKVILRGMREGLIAVDEDQVITLANPAAMNFLDATEDPRGRSLIEVSRNPHLMDVIASAENGQANEAEFELGREEKRQIHAFAAPLGEGAGCVVVLRDVTNVRRLEGMRRDFVANVSHELRTPISVIRANAETLLDGGLNDEARRERFVGAIGRQAERLSQLIADLLDLSRIEAGQVGLKLERLSLGELIQAACDTVADTAAKKDIALSTGVPDGTWVLADEGALKQVLINLVDNAVKYTPEKGAVEISAREETGGDQIAIEVSDTGPGIEPHLRERIFERFYRVDPGRSREMGGTGLGLSIVKHLVEGMGGSIFVEGRRPRGSRFVVRLPAPNPDWEKATVDESVPTPLKVAS
jgi:two-component system phosphate regulon sensor histidine kinase PhoR